MRNQWEQIMKARLIMRNMLFISPVIFSNFGEGRKISLGHE
jgi:hypothetical protein